MKRAILMLYVLLIICISSSVSAFERIPPQDRAANAASSMDGLTWDMTVSGEKFSDNLITAEALIMGLRVSTNDDEQITVYVEIDRDHRYFDRWLEMIRTRFNGAFAVTFSPEKLQKRQTIGSYLYPSIIQKSQNKDKDIKKAIGELLTNLDHYIGVNREFENGKMYHARTSIDYFELSKTPPNPHGCSYEFVEIFFWVPSGSG